MEVRFEALEHRSDGGFSPVSLRLEGDPGSGWQLERNGRTHLAFGPGFEALRSRACGVCATDLARRHLPFPLPQVIGHEVLAEDASGARRVVEINASCEARGIAPCPTCAAGRARHCPGRRVLGIHDLPGGFGAFVLAPVRASRPVPDALPDETAVLVEPFAAALHAVHTVAPRSGDRVVVLGPRRLGMLVIAALDAERRRDGTDVEIVAAARRPALEPLARALGADAFVTVDAAGLPADFADVVIDTTGAPEGLLLALRAARREVHLKSTAGQPAAGLRHPTALVVDELRVVPHAGDPPAGPVAWLAGGAPPPGLDAVTGTPAELARRAAGTPFETAVVDTARGADAAIRPEPGAERSLLRAGGTIRVRAGGTIRVADGPATGAGDSALLRAVAGRGIVVSTSRCGDFDAALARLGDDPRLAELGPRLVSHRFGPDALAEAFRVAATPEARKVLVVHPAL